MVISSHKFVLLASVAMLWSVPAWPDDNPNAATEAQTAKINAETALINAQAARDAAKASKDKAAIEALGLPKIDNKTELVDKDGAIETAMLSGQAVDAAAAIIANKAIKGNNASMIVVLGASEKLDLNTDKVMLTRINYLNTRFENADPQEKDLEAIGLPAIGAILSTVSGLLGSETKVSGVDLPEVDDLMLATAVAGKLNGKAILPSAGAGMIDITNKNSEIIGGINKLVALRKHATKTAAAISAKPKPAKKEQAAALKSVIEDFDAFYKDISTQGDDGRTPFVRALLVEMLVASDAQLLRVKVNRSGGTIVNSKNVGTMLLGLDPVRASGGLIATYSLVTAKDGRVVSAGSLACQTTQAKLREIQSGSWAKSAKATCPKLSEG